MNLKFLVGLPALASMALISQGGSAATWIESIPDECRAEIGNKLKDWRPLKVTAEVRALAKSQSFNPVVAKGDFDGDGHEDTAVLGRSGRSAVLTICLNAGNMPTLHIIRKPYCGDSVEAARKGGKHLNVETGRVVKLKYDGVSVSCFERASATYVWNGTAFIPIPDSD
jgi:hypothetical protein